MDLLDKYLVEGMTLRDEVRKAYGRYQQFGQNVGKISRRTKTMKNPLKIIAWYLVLENENFPGVSLKQVATRYNQITGEKLTDSIEYKSFRFHDEVPRRVCPTCGGSGEVRGV